MSKSKKELTKKIIDNNLSISDTILLLESSNETLFVLDILEYNDEFLLEQPEEKYIIYCKNIIKETQNCNIKMYFSKHLSENKNLTFTQVLSYYIKYENDQFEYVKNNERQLNPIVIGDGLIKSNDDNEGIFKKESPEIDPEIISVLEKYSTILKSVSNARQLISFLELGSITPQMLSSYSQIDDFPDSENFLNSEINKILDDRECELEDSESEFIQEKFNELLKKLNCTFECETYHYDQDVFIGLFHFKNLDTLYGKINITIGAIGPMDSQEYWGIDASAFIEVKKKEITINIWDAV